MSDGVQIGVVDILADSPATVDVSVAADETPDEEIHLHPIL